MSAQKPIFIIESNGFAAAQIALLLVRYALGDAAHIVDEAPNEEDSTVIAMAKPYRMGALMDRILALMVSEDAIVALGESRYLDCRSGYYFSAQDAEPVRLTEKEISLLVILAKAGGASVGREHLLDQIWRYVEGVETHTLETHIYRLRQKIEEDPASPKILKTDDVGYYLSAE